VFATGSKTARVGVQVFYFVNLCNRISTQWFVDAIDMILRFAQVEWGGVGEEANSFLSPAFQHILDATLWAFPSNF